MAAEVYRRATSHGLHMPLELWDQCENRSNSVNGMGDFLPRVSGTEVAQFFDLVVAQCLQLAITN